MWSVRKVRLCGKNCLCSEENGVLMLGQNNPIEDY